MINFIEISQHETIQHLSGSKLVEALRQLNKNPELKNLIKSLTPVDIINGQKIVQSSFLDYLLNLDAIKASEEMLNIEKHSPEADSDECLALSMFIGAIKEAFLLVVNEINFDFSSNNVTWDEYIKGVRSFGFEEVSRKSYIVDFSDREEESVLFFNREHSMLWTINSSSFSQKRASGTSLYFCGKIKNKDKPFPDFLFSVGHLAPSGVFYFDINMDNIPAHKFFEIFKHFEPVSHWGIFNVWDKKVVDQVKKLPNYVKMPMLDYNIMSHDQNDYLKNERNSIVSIKAIEIINKLKPEQQIYLNLFCRAQKFSDVNTLIMPSFVQTALNELKNNELYKSYVISSIMYNMKHTEKETTSFIGDRGIFRAIIDTLKKDDLVDFYNTYLNMQEDFKKLYFTEDDQDFLFEKMNG